MELMTLFFSLLISFLAVRGFRFEFGAKVLVLRNTESFVWLLLFLFFTRFFIKSIRCPNRRLKIYSLLFGIIIGLFQVIGGSLERMTGISWILQDMKMLANFLNMYFSFACLYYAFAFIAFSYLDKHSKVQYQAAAEKNRKRYILLIWGILLIFYIPWYLYFFPGILTYDSGAQLWDAMTVKTLSDHNPAFVTLLIRAVILPVMKLTGSIQISVGVCTALQMLIVTFVFSLSFAAICRYIHNNILRGIIFVWFALYPVNNIYSFTMWKDILFSVCVLLFLLILDKCLQNENEFFKKTQNPAILFLTLLLMPLLRHNGIAITVTMLFCLPFQVKRYRKQMSALVIGALAIFGIWKLLILPAVNAKKSPSYELLNVPIQQISRVLSNHHGEISPWLQQEIEAYFNIPEFWTEYWEKIADPVKAHFNNNLYQNDPGKFFSLWAQLGKKYPVEYLESFLQNNYGYWYPETTWWIVGRGVIINVNIQNLYQAPILRLKIIDKIYNWFIDGQYLKTPLLPLLFKPGAYWWMWVFCGLYILYANRRKFILFIPGVMLWLTLQFSAVYCEFRYAYPLIVCLPFLMAAALTKVQRD